MTPRQAAFAAGLPHYSTGKPCKFGHLTDRFTCDGCCVECKSYQARKRQENRLGKPFYRPVFVLGKPPCNQPNS